MCGDPVVGSVLIASKTEYMRTYPAVITILETHISGRRADEVCNDIGFQGRYRVEAQGFQGGIWVLWVWDTNELNLNILKGHPQFVASQVYRKGMQPWYFTVVYASSSPQQREQLWSEIESFSGSINMPWILEGDSNETNNMEERDHGGDEMVRRCLKCNNVIKNNGLLDLGFSGPKFTWS